MRTCANTWVVEAPEWSQKSKKENEDKGLINESGKY